MALTKSDKEEILRIIKLAQEFKPEPPTPPAPPEPPKVEIEIPKQVVPNYAKPDPEPPVVPEQYQNPPGNGWVKFQEKLAGLKFGQKRELSKNPATTYIVTMLYGNATLDHFVVKTAEPLFYYRKKYYHLNKDKAWFDINSNQLRLIYYEDYVEPMDKAIAIEGDKSFLKITPQNLKPVFEMEYVKVISQSQQLTKWIKIAVYLIVANLFFTGIMVLIMLVQSGIFSNLKL